METLITPEQDTNIKSHIEAEFLIISRDYVPTLRAFITTKAPGNQYTIFREFKKRFDSLFMLSSSKKELNRDIVDKVREWLESKQTGSNWEIKTGLTLFTEYKNELFKMNVLRLGV